MNQFSKNQKRIFMLIIALIVLTGCVKRPVEGDLSQLYSLSTSFKEVWDTSKFSALFVLPITYVINYVIEVLNWGVVAGIGIATIVVNLITFPIMLSSQKGSAKMQLIQPKINSIEKKYENRTDQQSMMMKTQEIQKLYKDNDIKMMSTLLGSFIPLPLLMAMLSAVYYASSLWSEANLFMGASLNVKPTEGFMAGPNNWIYIVIFLLMVALQYVSMKLPQYLTKKRLESDRSYKKYDKAQQAKDPMGGMTNMMIGMMVFIAITTPTTISIYYIFSSLMTIARSYMGDVMLNKENEEKSKDRRVRKWNNIAD